jgi:hypothetical protein
MPQKVVWDDIEWEPVMDEVSRKVIMGDNMMMVLYKFAKGTISRWSSTRPSSAAMFINSIA